MQAKKNIFDPHLFGKRELKAGEYPDLNVLFEDNHVLAIIKPSGIPTQSDITGDMDIQTIAKEYIKKKYGKPGNVYIGLVHRLDRSVSGPLILARTSKAAARLSESFRNHNVKKLYHAVVIGSLPSKDGVCEDYIKKNSKLKIATCCKPETKGAKLATLKYRVLKQYKMTEQEIKNLFGEFRLQRSPENPSATHPLSLLEVELFTGRFHQIRCQLSKMGFPILGDIKYNSNFVFKRRFLALQSVYLEFPHPSKNQNITVKGDEKFLEIFTKFQSN